MFMANNLSEQQILEIAKKSIDKIKKGDNPYKNLGFVDTIFEGCDDKVKKDIKSLIKENFEGKLKTNLFESGKLTPAHHLYNYLYENNLLSKYNNVAEYMDYPSAIQLKKKIVENYDEFEDEGQIAEESGFKILKDLFKKTDLSNINEIEYPNLNLKIRKTNSTSRNNMLFKTYFIGEEDANGVITIEFENGKMVLGRFNIEGVIGRLSNSVD